MWDKELENLYKAEAERTIELLDNTATICHDTKLTSNNNSNVKLLLSKNQVREK